MLHVVGLPELAQIIGYLNSLIYLWQKLTSKIIYLHSLQKLLPDTHSYLKGKIKFENTNATATKLKFWEIAMEVSNAQLEFKSESGYQFYFFNFIGFFRNSINILGRGPRGYPQGMMEWLECNYICLPLDKLSKFVDRLVNSVRS